MSEPYIENRGTEETPFGFIYFDDTRVGFSNLTDNPPVWASRGWGTPSSKQFSEALKMITERYPNTYGKFAKKESAK